MIVILRPILDWLWDLGGFVGRVILGLPRGAARPGELVRQFERVMWGSLPLVTAAGLSVGLVSWLQTRRLLQTYGSEALLPSVLAVAVLGETGPILAGLLVAGRMGAGLAAELGSMVASEQVDALEVLGTPAVPMLVVPRVLACALALPLLTVVLDAAALLGGLAAESAADGLSAEAYWQRSLTFLRLTMILPATLKTAVFGLVVGLVGCRTGLTVDGSSESVGRAATRGMVRASIAVLAVNVVLVPCINAGVAALGWKG